MKKISLLGTLFVIVGLSIAGYAGYQIFDQKKKTDTALETAKEIVADGQTLVGESFIEGKIKENKKEDGSGAIINNQVIGILYFPTLQKELPIIEGTNEDDLEKGVGHYQTTKLPNEGDQILLSGHRDTVFRRLGELKIGDILEVKMPYGSFKYQIASTDIVPSNDTSVIHSTAPDEILTLSTCYPFHFVGNAPKRYIIYAKRLYEKNS